ncbi:MAG TPA: asparagine--tRNA ligase [Candidatus Acidoferrales bacterium]|jgi:asparaginyl-tRNA synthetase|nr:asparagine--tRNA ligase [Candidatus Acidoferrales bacterium]
MAIISIDEAGKYEGQEVTIRGWLYNLRESGKLMFPIFRDGTGVIQGVCALKENPQAFEALKGLTQESSVIVTGTIRAEQRAPGGFEMGVSKIQVLQKVSEAQPYPIQLKEHGVDFLLDHRHLWIRTPRQASILRIRAEAVRAARNFMDSQGYILTDAPMFTPAACEGTSTLFEVNYIDDQKAYLTQSGQLYIEATAMALGKVYTFGPTFRAEKSKTRRHLTEFWMLEPEAAYAELGDMMNLAEGLVSAVVQSVLKNKSRELELLKRETRTLENVKPPFPRISYEEAIGILNKHNNPTKFGDDIGGDEETIVSNEFDRPVLVHRYPASIKAFYMQPDPQRPDLALAFDMLAPEGYGEIIGGSQRIHDYDLLVKRLHEYKLPEEPFQWYLDLRRYGSVPHAGFGLGLERTVAWICGTEHIREVIPFPRMIYRVYP